MLKKVFTRNPAKWLFYGAISIVYYSHRIRGAVNVVTVYGDNVARPYLQYKIFQLCGLRVRHVEQPSRAQCVHLDATVREVFPGINGNCSDISKSHVAALFERVVGYPLSVDPLTFSGLMVRKSEANAAHDGVVLQGPLARTEPGFAYQRLIEAADSRGDWVDLRPCIVGKEIPFVYVKRRDVARRFENAGNRVRAVAAATVFSRSEIALLLETASHLGLDIGEMDVVRDRGDKRIYVVDVANTPHSPGDAFISWAGLKCMFLAAAAFRRQFPKIARPPAVPDVLH